MGQISPNYDPVGDTISQMGASSNPYAAILNNSYVLYGLLMCCAAYGFYLRLNYSTLARTLAVFLVIHAVASIFLAAFPDSPDFPGKLFTEDLLHNSFSAIVSLTLLACILVFFKISRQEKALKVAATFGIIVIFVSLPLPIANIFEPFKSISGLLQRVIIGSSFVWIGITSLLLIRKSNRIEVTST